MKPNTSISTIFINKNDELIIKTPDESQLDELKKWPKDAFISGIEEIIKIKRFYLALHNVDTKESAGFLFNIGLSMKPSR